MSRALSQKDSDIYARRLLPKGVGYPLWIPEPNATLPLEYRERGVSIGDVGVVTSRGSFDFLFNICLAADHPVNAGAAPPDFVPLTLGPRDTDGYPNIYDENGHVASIEITKAAIELETGVDANPIVPVGFGGGFRFSCATSEGAILMLPNGADCEDLLNLDRFLDYAIEHGVRWYQHVNGPVLGRRATNGSLYLVTGSVKSKSWGVAAFSNTSDDCGFSLAFKAATIAGASAACSYSWESIKPVASRTGPRRIGEESPLNQCVFIRGFRISARTGVWSSLFGQVKASLVTDTSPKELLKRSGQVPFTGGRTQSGSTVNPRRDDQSTSPREDDEEYSLDNDHHEDINLGSDVYVEHIPTIAEQDHPGHVINQFILENVLSTQKKDVPVAVTHDSVWCALMNEEDPTIPDDDELIRRFCNKWTLQVRNGGVFSGPADFSYYSLALLRESKWSGADINDLLNAPSKYPSSASQVIDTASNRPKRYFVLNSKDKKYLIRDARTLTLEGRVRTILEDAYDSGAEVYLFFVNKEGTEAVGYAKVTGLVRPVPEDSMDSTAERSVIPGKPSKALIDWLSSKLIKLSGDLRSRYLSMKSDSVASSANGMEVTSELGQLLLSNFQAYRRKSRDSKTPLESGESVSTDIGPAEA